MITRNWFQWKSYHEIPEVSELESGVSLDSPSSYSWHCNSLLSSQVYGWTANEQQTEYNPLPRAVQTIASIMTYNHYIQATIRVKEFK